MIVSLEERLLGVLGDDYSETRVFSVPRVSNNRIDLSSLHFFLDFIYSNGTKNTTSLTKIVYDKEIELTWNIIAEDLQVEGTVLIQMHANDLSGNVKWSTSPYEPFLIGDCIDTAGNYTGSLSALQELLTRCVDIEQREAGRASAEEQREIIKQLMISATNAANTATSNAKAVTTAANNKILDVEERFNNLTSQHQQESEVIDARKGKESLRLKIDDIDKQLTDIAINVKYFGAKCDGVNDDATAIRAAVAFLNSLGGGVVLFPEGTCLLNSCDPDYIDAVIKLSTKISFKGKGANSILKAADGLIDRTKHIFARAEADQLIENVFFEDLVIDLNSANNMVLSSTPTKFFVPIYVRYVNNFLVNRVVFRNCPSRNIIYVSNYYLDLGHEQSKNVTITNCEFNNLGPACAGSEAQDDHSSLYIQAEEVWILNNYFHNDNANLDYSIIKSNAIEIHSERATVKNNIIINMDVPFIISAAECDVGEVLIKDNQIENTNIVAYGLTLSTGSKAIKNITFDNVTGSTRTSGSASLFWFSDQLKNSVPVERLSIKNCRIINNYADTVKGLANSNLHNFITCFNTKLLEVTGNEFDGCGGRGIYVAPIDGITEITITQNRLRNCSISTLITAGSSYCSFLGMGNEVVTKSLVVENNITEKSDIRSQVEFIINLIGKYTVVSVSDNKIIGYTGAISINDNTQSGQKMIRHACYDSPRTPRAVSASLSSEWVDLTNNIRYVKKYNHNKPYAGWLVEMNAISSPTSGTYLQGDKIINSTPEEQGTAPNKYIVDGWLCVSGGSPGTWVPQRTPTGN